MWIQAGEKMETSQLDKPSDRDAELYEKRLAEFADAVRDLRHAVDGGNGRDIVMAANDVDVFAGHASLNREYKAIVGLQVIAIQNATAITDKDTGKLSLGSRELVCCMVAAIEQMIELQK
jgi:hypothetical protein